MRAGKTFYEILGVTEDSEPAVIDAAYRALMKKYHPDAGGGSERSQEINEAYSVLRDERRRRDYDASLAARNSDSRARAQAPTPHRHTHNQTNRPSTKSCPDCAETVQQAARVCRYCGYEFDSERNAGADDAPIAKRPFSFGWTMVALAAATLLVLVIMASASPSDRLPERASTEASAASPTTERERTSNSAERPAPQASQRAATDWRGKKGRCSLVVGNQTYIDGPCWISLDADGSFQITSLDGQYFALLFRDAGPPFGYWNGGPGSTHAQDPLGEMTRHGACWESDRGKMCAWAS